MKKLFVAAIALTTIASQANAYDQNTVLFGLGADNLRGSTESRNDTAGLAEVEVRGASFDNVLGVTGISPLVGAQVDWKGAGYVFGGFLWDWNFYDRWHLIPNLGIGAYEHGNGKDLGGVLEFHDSLGLEYGITPASRIGLEFTHMSNAGIYSHNPGKEDLLGTYSMGF